MIDVVLYVLATIGALAVVGALWLAGWVALCVCRAALAAHREHDERVQG